MELLDRAQQWADHDPDGRTAAALSASVAAARGGDAAALEEVAAAMAGPLEFGTAGLRGRMGPGESRMNLAVVIRATSRARSTAPPASSSAATRATARWTSPWPPPGSPRPPGATSSNCPP